MSQTSPKRCNKSKVKNYRSFDGTGLLQGNQYAHCDFAVESSSSLSTGTSFNGRGLVELAGVFGRQLLKICSGSLPNPKNIAMAI